MDSCTSSPTALCLGVAVDHRIRSLFRPIRARTQASMPGDPADAQLLKSLADRRTDRYISKDEIDITLELFGPQATGGITVVLQQPWRFHPYWKGIEAVVGACPTFSAVDEAFSAASCGTISIGSSTLSIIDSLPFVRPQDNLSSWDRWKIRNTTNDVIITKDPDVVLCMWRQAKNNELGPMSEFRSLGIGHDFDQPTLCLRPGSVAERVNSFHPSFAINFNPYNSCFRQLLLLNVAKACRIYEGTWREEEWMDSLKERCKEEAKTETNLRKSDLKYCGRYLRSQLNQIRKWIVAWILSSQNNETDDIDNNTLREWISERFNDASLCLWELGYQDTAIHPDDITPDNRSEISSGRKQCYRFLTGIICSIRGSRCISAGTSRGVYDPDSLKSLISSLTVAGSPVHRNLWTTFGRFLENLNLSFTKADGGNTYTFDFNDISDLFLSVAVSVENILQGLLHNGDCQAAETQGLEDRIAGLKI